MSIWPFSRSQVRPPVTTANDNPPSACCSFCKRPRKHVGPMVEGPNDVYICVNCVRLAHQVAEAHGMQPVGAEINDASVKWSAHMHILCYFRLERAEGEQWRAVADHPKGIVGYGGSPKEAVRNLQANVLSKTATSLAESGVMDNSFTNHADPRFR